MRHIAVAILLFFFFFSTSLLASATELLIPEIIKEGTPGDVLMEDPILPTHHSDTRFDAGSGSIQKSLSDELAVPVVGVGAPGNTAQLRGLGRSAEDTDVQVLGVPLNPAQGGGFDLSVFPQFIWSGFNYQVGPALGTFDPRGTAGALTLTPWTAKALSEGRPAESATAFVSTANLFQVSAEASDGKGFAVVAGNSSGDSQGPSAALSLRVSNSGHQAVTFHLLATDLDSKTPGPARLTPNAHQQSARVIPLLQLDLPMGSQGLLKSSLFYDWSLLRYDDPSASALPFTQDRVQQVGIENVLLWNEWKFGVVAREVKYETLAIEAQNEAVFSVQASRTFEMETLLIEPTVRGVGVTRYGMLPEGSLGVRQSQGASAWFARVGYARHFPSLLNRFYTYPGFPGYPGFVGNPSLSPESDWTGTIGTEWKSAPFEASLQFYAQFAQDAQVRAPLIISGNGAPPSGSPNDTVINQGNARIASASPAILVRPVGWLDLGARATLAASQLSQNGLAFPGLPGFLGILSGRVHSQEDDAASIHRWQFQVIGRFSSASLADTSGNQLSPYQEVDLEADTKGFHPWTIGARLEDVLNQQPQLVLGYPGVGRTFSVAVSRNF